LNKLCETENDLTEIPFCSCGCGKPVAIAKRTISSRGIVKGMPNKYVFGHHKKAEGYWTGKKMPEEACKKMSESGHKKKLSEEHKRNISESLKGRVFSEETIKKFIGKKQSLETRMKKSEAQKGNKGSNWRGGVSEENNRIRQSIEFAEWRKAVFERDNYTCQKCGAKLIKSKTKNIILHPHHIKSFADYPEFRFDVDNGITLCKDCHKNEHRRSKKCLNQYMSLNRRQKSIAT
jgi:predicted restriction endonuclease